MEAEGVKVICPAEIEYAEADNVVPAIVILVIAPLQVGSSVKVTLKGASTVGEDAAVIVGEVKAEAPLAVILKSSIARQGLLLPDLVHLKNISVFDGTETVKVPEILVLFAEALPSKALPPLV